MRGCIHILLVMLISMSLPIGMWLAFFQTVMFAFIYLELSAFRNERK